MINNIALQAALRDRLAAKNLAKVSFSRQPHNVIREVFDQVSTFYTICFIRIQFLFF
jgi:hypothetical protein